MDPAPPPPPTNPYMPHHRLVTAAMQVGLWDIDHTAAAGADDSTDTNSSGYDGVLMFAPHRDYVSSMRWLGQSGTGLLTGSYDGLVRKLDVETGGQEGGGVLQGMACRMTKAVHGKHRTLLGICSLLGACARAGGGGD